MRKQRGQFDLSQKSAHKLLMAGCIPQRTEIRINRSDLRGNDSRAIVMELAGQVTEAERW